MTGHHHLPTSLCPACGQTLDCATSAEGDAAAPKAGDVTFCGSCSEVLVFGEDLRQRRPTDEERAAFDPETLASIGRVQGALKAAAARRVVAGELAPGNPRQLASQALQAGFQAGWTAALLHFGQILEKNIAKGLAEGSKNPGFPGREMLQTVQRLAKEPPRPGVTVVGRFGTPARGFDA